MQIVILAGGLGNRMYPLTKSVPKSMIRVLGRPFLEYQLDLIRQNKLLNVVLCVGHMADQIKDYFRDGSQYGVRIQYSGDNAAGTGGALKMAEGLLEDPFFLIWGDSFVPIEFQPLVDRMSSHPCIGVMAVFENHDKFDKSNIILEGDFVAKYDKQAKNRARLTHIDAGISLFTTQLLSRIPERIPCSLEEDVFPKLAKERQLLGLETPQRFYEIGSHSGLCDFEAFVQTSL